MKYFTIIFSLLMFILFTQNADARKMSAHDIVEKAQDAGKLSGSEAVAVMTIYDSKGNARIRKTKQASKLYDNGKTEKKIIKFLSPADVKGTGLLTFDYEDKSDDMWLFMPALRKTRRIVSSEKAKSFMGSEFSYADMTPPRIEDFKYKLLGEEKIDGKNCWKIEQTPINEDVEDENGYSKKLAYIAKDDYLIRKAIFYDFDGELLKILTAKNIKLLDKKNNKYRATYMEMVNKQNGRKSVLKIEKIQFNPNVKDEYFTTGYLER
ncbi:outer membrane lipoprotein-sorting protein [Bacteroidota bacterium]